MESQGHKAKWCNRHGRLAHAENKAECPNAPSLRHIATEATVFTLGAAMDSNKDYTNSTHADLQPALLLSSGHTYSCYS